MSQEYLILKVEPTNVHTGLFSGIKNYLDDKLPHYNLWETTGTQSNLIATARDISDLARKTVHSDPFEHEVFNINRIDYNFLTINYFNLKTIDGKIDSENAVILPLNSDDINTFISEHQKGVEYLDRNQADWYISMELLSRHGFV